MPTAKQQPTDIIKNIESELKFLKDFFETEENKSISLLDLINLEKSKELINKTPNLQKIFLQDEDLKIQKAILDLFEQGTNKGLIKQLNAIKDKFEKINQDQKQINSLINTYKNKQEIEEKIKYIYLRILVRKISIANLAKLKLLTDIIGENEISDYIKILQDKFSDQGKPGQIAFIHLNNIFDEDTEKELRELGNKKTIKRPPTQAAQPEQAAIVESTTASSSHLDSLSDLSSSSEKISTSTPTQSLDSKPVIVRPPKDKNSNKVVDSLFVELTEKKQTIRDLNAKIITLESEIEHQKKQTISETQPETSSVKTGLEKIQQILKNRQNTTYEEKLAEKENLIKDLKNSLQTENEKTKLLTDEVEVLTSQHEKSIQKLETDLNQAKINLDQSQKSVDISTEEAEKSKQVIEDLKKNVNTLQTEYDSQLEFLKRVDSELESTKKLLGEAQDNLSQKDVQLKETKETVSQLKNLQPDLNAANEKVNRLNAKQSSLETEITTIQAENQKLNTELQENQIQKAKLENTLKNLGNTLQSNESENQKKLFEATETIQELKEKIQTNSNSIEDKESEINTLKSELIEIQSKSEQLEKRNHLLENQAEQLTTESNIISDENATLHQNLTQAQKKIGALESEIHSHQNKLKGLSENTLADSKQISALKSQLNNLNKSNEKLDIEIAALKKSSDQADQTIVNLKNEKDNLEEALQLEQQKFSQADDKKNNLQDKLDKLNKTDSSNQATISAFETQLDDLTTLKSEQDLLIQNLEKKLTEKDLEIESLTVKNQQRIGELKQLNEKLTDTQNTFNKLEHEIIDLKAEQDVFKKKDSENKNQIDDLETTIQKSAAELTDFKSQFQQLKIAKKGLEDEKLDLDKRISELEQQNTEFRELLDKSADNDEFVIELERNKTQIEKQLMTAQSELKILTEKLKSNEKADSNLKDNYAKLEEKLSKKNSELDQIKLKLAAALEHLKDVQEKTKEQGKTAMPMHGEDLINFEIPDSGDNHLIHPATNVVHNTGSTSSGRASGESSPVSDDDKLVNPFNSNPFNSSSDSLFNSGSSIEDPMDPFNLTGAEESPRVPKITHLNTGTTNMLTQEEQDANRLISIKKGMIDAFKQENHQAIIEAFTKEFSRIATHAAESLQADVEDVLPEFKDKLEETATDKITHLISQLHNKPNLLSPSIERIHSKGGIGAQTYLEEVTNSASFIFGNLQLDGGKNYMTYIEDIGKVLLINLCIEYLQTNEKSELLESAEMMLADKASDNALQPNEHTETIKTTAEEFVTKLLKKDNLDAVLKEASENLGELNLLTVSKQKLQEQLEQQVNQNPDHYFPDIHLNPILEKISNNIALSEEELRKIPSELQYTDTAEEFVNGLRLKYPKLSSNYENKISDEIFKKSRLILRKNASPATNITLPDEVISDLTPERWLEEQLLLITGKPTKLEQIELEKDQKNLLNELNSALHLSTFYDIALTPKSITELKAEIEKSNHAQLAATRQANELFAEIENKQKEYLGISNDPVPEFLQKIEEETNTEILRFNPEGAKKLFSAIDTHLLKVGKWDYFNAKVFNYKLKDITNELLATIPNNDYEKDPIEKTIKYAIGFLCEKNSKDKLHKEQILKDIALCYASTKKLSTFNGEIANRKVKIENLFGLKDKKDRETQTTTGNPSAAFAGIFLPHNCTIIADSFDPNLEILANSEFKMLTDTFYASNAMQVGQTVTFEQKLSDNKSKEWSVTRDANSFAYNTSSWVDRLKNVGDRIRNKIDPFTSSQLSSKDQEVTYAAFQHAVASSKGPVLTLSIGANCSVKKEKYIRQLIEVFNQNSRINGQKTTIFIDDNYKLKIHKDAKTTMKNEIDIKNSPSKELGKAAEQSDEALKRHTTTLRGRG